VSTIEQCLTSGSCRVVFTRIGDRFAHRIELFSLATGETVACLESLEGTPEDSWPPSPPLKELHFEDRSKQTVALAVGMAGRSHWALAVEADTDHLTSDEGGRIVFDVACRIAGEPAWLGSHYRLDVATGRADEEPRLEASGRLLQLPDGWQLKVLGDESHAERLVIRSPYEIHVVPQLAEPTTWPTTIRWRYAVYRDLNSGRREFECRC